MAAPRTMILFDPDLIADLIPPCRVLNGSKVSARTAIPRRQRIPTARTIARFLGDAQAAVKLRGTVTVLLTTDQEIRRLNRQFRGKNKATDVLSFPASPFQNGKPADRIAGDVAISIPTARRQAEERGHQLATEIRVLILHGLLHLAGFDHETDSGEMAKLEQKLRGKLRLPYGLIERETAGEGAHTSSPAGKKGRRR